MQDFKRIVDYWKAIYSNARESYLRERFCEERNISIDDQDCFDTEGFKEYRRVKLEEQESRYKHKRHFDNFDVYLQVYDLRQEGKSWNDIYRSMGLNSLQTARDHCNSAENLINKGVKLYF